MFEYGPAAWQCCYPINRRFFSFFISGQNKEIFVWSNFDDSVIMMTQFDVKKFGVKNFRLSCRKGCILASATVDDKYLYYTIVQPGKAST